MTTPIALRILIAAGATLLAPSLHAQQFIGSAASGCGTPTVGGEVTMAATAPVIIGDTVIVAVASGSDSVASISVTDARGNVYRPFGAERAALRRFAVVHFIARANTAWVAGDLLRVRVGHPSPAQEICARASVFRGVVTTINALDTQAGAEATGNVLSLTARNGSFAAMLNFASFSTAGNGGGFSAAAGNVAVPATCSAGNALCLVSAFNFSGASGSQTVAVDSVNAVPWAGTLSTFYTTASVLVFQNGFE